jgi:poly-gamma-glutamate synthesis protein (capsule biosynthesis protein)
MVFCNKREEENKQNMPSIIISGDFAPMYRAAELVAAKQYNDVFGNIIPVIKNADYAVVNLECPVVANDNVVDIPKCGPNLKCSENAVAAIKAAGFGLATLANNHIRDFGDEGVSSTLQTCEEYRIDCVGAGKNITCAKQVFYKNVKDKKFAFVNFCENEFSIATEKNAGANPLNIAANYYQIQEAKQNADYTIVIVHGGHEHYQLPSPRMKEQYRFFADAGANVIINHHQHCFSGYEVYNATPIFYGLGNFCFDGPNNPHYRNSIWNEGFMVQLNFEDEKIGFELYPYRRCDEKPEVRLMDKKEREKFYSKIQEVNAIIADDEALLQNFIAFANSKRDEFRVVFQPYHNRIFNKLFRMKLLPDLIFRGKKKYQILNFIECEAHRDVLLYNLNQIK